MFLFEHRSSSPAAGDTVSSRRLLHHRDEDNEVNGSRVDLDFPTTTTTAVPSMPQGAAGMANSRGHNPWCTPPPPATLASHCAMFIPSGLSNLPSGARRQESTPGASINIDHNRVLGLTPLRMAIIGASIKKRPGDQTNPLAFTAAQKAAAERQRR